MATALRKRVCPSTGNLVNGAFTPYQEYKLWNAAVSKPIPEYRAKLVTIANGQYEVSVTPANTISVINARMGFNPLLDCPRREREPAEQEERDIENRQRATKRARQNVRHLVKAAFADHMLTFNYRENVTDRAAVVKDWHEFVRLFRIRFPDWTYLAVLEKQERGSYHIHVAVKGRQNIKWALRCWLKAIGQPAEEINDWYNNGNKLGTRSLGNVDVQAPKARWGGTHKLWKRDKLSSYLTKYIGKEFDESTKGAKKYWASRNIEKPVTERFWLKATNFLEAIKEAHDLIYSRRADNISMWADASAGVVWITGEVDKEALSWEHCEQAKPDFDLLEEEPQESIVKSNVLLEWDEL
ncbi:MAG: hypothetical protein PHD65_05420 [Gallionella sp.]|nr:hypothetical protein [Gallionella sp.]